MLSFAGGFGFLVLGEINKRVSRSSKFGFGLVLIAFQCEKSFQDWKWGGVSCNLQISC